MPYPNLTPLESLVAECARRDDTHLWIMRGVVYVQVGKGALSRVYTAYCMDDKTILKIVHELKFGAYAPRNAAPQEKEAA